MIQHLLQDRSSLGVRKLNLGHQLVLVFGAWDHWCNAWRVLLEDYRFGWLLVFEVVITRLALVMVRY